MHIDRGQAPLSLKLGLDPGGGCLPILEDPVEPCRAEQMCSEHPALLKLNLVEVSFQGNFMQRHAV